MARHRKSRPVLLSLAALSLSLSLLLSLSAAAAERPMQAFDGVARLGNLDRVTVIYPAADGPRGKINRDSARLRASWLRLNWGVDASIAADDAVDEEQLAGHILVLGWDNRLIETEEVRKVLTRDEVGFTFAGLRGPPGTDLLFMFRSPYTPQKYMAFWSRIDPERDLLFAFPFIGSDWVIYEDFYILKQGMFQESESWPPAPNPFAQRDREAFDLPDRHAAGHYVVFYDSGAVHDTDLAQILEAREQALSRAAEQLQVTIPEGFRIGLYVYADKEQKIERTGNPDATHSFARRRATYMPLDLAKTPNPTEELHVLADAVYGSCSINALYYGLVVAEQSGSDELNAYAALLAEKDAVPTIGKLLDGEELRQMNRSGYGFAAAGLLVRWILERGGSEALARAYDVGWGDAVDELAEILDLDGAAAVEADFAGWIAGLAGDAQDELAYRKAMAHARERAVVGDLVGQAEGLTAALTLRPDDLTLAYQLSVVRIDLGQYDEARELLESQILGDSSSARGTSLEAFATYQLGRALQYQGDLEGARRRFESVLALPDEHESHRLAREALEELDEEAAADR